MSLQFSLRDDGAWLLGGHLLHPAHDPLKAACDDELGRLLKDAGPDDLLLLAGCGLGWHIKAVLDHADPPRVLVYEPDAGRLADMYKYGPSLPDLDLATDETSLAEALGKFLVYGQTKRVAFYSPLAYRKALPELVKSARTLLDHTLARSQADAATRSLKSDVWLENLEKNITWWPRLPDLTLLSGILPGMPALVIGAGPSLDQSLQHLAGVTDRALVLAAASALKPLASVGVFPHIAFALEAKDESRQFSGVDHSQTLLSAASTGHPNHFQQWSGSMSLFHLWPWAAMLAGLGRSLPTGGHVTSAAFSLAVLWGCDPIVLVGQDLAYTHGRVHASGRPGGEDEEQSETMEIPAINGGKVRTSPVMLGYLLWYEEAASTLKKSRRCVINATAAGAYLTGFEHKSLAEVLVDLPQRKEELRAVIEGVNRLPCPKASFLVQRIAETRLDLQAILRALEREGLEAARASLRKGSVAEAAFEENIRPGQSRDSNIRFIKRLIEALDSMAQGLYQAFDLEKPRQ